MSTRSRLVVGVVDDDYRMLESLADVLESAGHCVRLYSSAGLLWADTDLGSLDCLISDIGMPDTDGFALQRWASAQRPPLPVILITGRPELRDECTAMLVDGYYFEKPFDTGRLLEAVAAAVAASRLRSETHNPR